MINKFPLVRKNGLLSLQISCLSSVLSKDYSTRFDTLRMQILDQFLGSHKFNILKANEYFEIIKNTKSLDDQIFLLDSKVDLTNFLEKCKYGEWAIVGLNRNILEEDLNQLKIGHILKMDVDYILSYQDDTEWDIKSVTLNEKYERLKKKW